MAEKRIDHLVGLLNELARTQIQFMNFFPAFSDQLVSGLADYLGEPGCVRPGNSGDDFSFDEDYGHSGLAVEGGKFVIPLILRIRDHASCEEGKDRSPKTVDSEGASGKRGKGKGKGKKKKKSQEKAALVKSAKVRKSSKKKKKGRRKACNETFLRFKLLCERGDDGLLIDIAGKEKVSIDPENLTPLYEAIFRYLTVYFSPETFFDKDAPGESGYQNTSYGFLGKIF